MLVRPVLITFDMFGTVLDWRTGLEESWAAAGRPLRDGEFDRIVDFQGQLEQSSAEPCGPLGHAANGSEHRSGRDVPRLFLPYSEVTRRSLVEVIGLPEARAAEIGAQVGSWPLFTDSRDALRALMRIAPCAAMTNSDRVHGEQIQAQLGFRMSDWLCAEDVRVYKPNPAFWRAMAARGKIEYEPSWWHVAAYADYDLVTAAELGLTTVFVDRSHARPGAASLSVRDLAELASQVARDFG